MCVKITEVSCDPEIIGVESKIPRMLKVTTNVVYMCHLELLKEKLGIKMGMYHIGCLTSACTLPFGISWELSSMYSQQLLDNNMPLECLPT